MKIYFFKQMLVYNIKKIYVRSKNTKFVSYFKQPKSKISTLLSRFFFQNYFNAFIFFQFSPNSWSFFSGIIYVYWTLGQLIISIGEASLQRLQMTTADVFRFAGPSALLSSLSGMSSGKMASRRFDR